MAYDKKFWEEIKEEFGNEFGNSSDENDTRPFIHLYLENDHISKDSDSNDAHEEDPLWFKPYAGALCIQLWDDEKKNWDGYLQFIPYEDILQVKIFR